MSTGSGATTSGATTDALEERMRRFRRSGARADRDEVVFVLLPLVRHVVSRSLGDLPPSCDADDLAAAGCEAVVATVEAYDPGCGESIEQVAWARVREAVLAELAASRRVTEDVRRRALAGRPEAAGDGRGREGGPAEGLADPAPCVDPAIAAEIREARSRVRDAMARLPDREREVANLLWLEERRLREVGERLGVSESRACQIATRLRSRLRDGLGPHADLLTALAC